MPACAGMTLGSENVVGIGHRALHSCGFLPTSHFSSVNPLHRILFPAEMKDDPSGSAISCEIKHQLPGRPSQGELAFRIGHKLNVGRTGEVCEQLRPITLDRKDLFVAGL